MISHSMCMEDSAAVKKHDAKYITIAFISGMQKMLHTEKQNLPCTALMALNLFIERQ